MTTPSRLADLLGFLSEPALVLSLEGRIVDRNTPAERELAVAETFAELAENPRRAATLLARWRRTSSPTPGTVRLATRTGTRSYRVDGARATLSDAGPHVLVRLRQKRHGSGAFSVLSEKVGRLGREVTRRRRAESRLAWQVEILELIAAGAPLEKVLERIAECVESESGPGTHASILLVEDGVLRHGAAPSLPDEYVRAIDGVAIGPQVGSCGTAAHRGEPVFVEDIATDPLWAEFKELALAHDLRACWSVPVKLKDGQVVATVAHYDECIRTPASDDRGLAEVASYLVGIAMEGHLRERALRDRAEELLRINERTHEFLALLGHELRNPLAPMATTLELLRGDPSDDDRREWLSVMARQLSVVRRHVDDLLDISRVMDGRLTLRREVIDLRPTVKAACEAADERVTLECPDEPLWVDGDADRLAQVVGDLLSNAEKFSDPSSAITVTVGRADDHAVIVVRDRGVGIEAKELQRIFDLFAQTDRSVDRAQGGLGLGLTLALQLVRQHDGALEAYSEGLGRGSEFTVRLPLTDPPAQRAMESAPAAVERSLSVLVVDDNEDAADLLARLLSRWGHTTAVAYDGAEALETAAERAWDIVILDIGLPALDGFEVARALRQRPELAASTLIALTGYGQARDRERAAESGFDEFLVKPVDVPRLKQIIAARAANEEAS